MAYDIALPEEDSRTLQDYLDVLRRRGATAAKLAAALLVVGLVIIFLWPNTYRSMATILIEDPEIPPGLVPTTVTTFAERQIQYINTRVMTRTNLAQIIEKFNLYPDERKYLPTLLLVEDVQQDVKIELMERELPDQQTGMARISTIAFQVGFEHTDPNTARQVANELVSLYLAENVRARTEQTAETSQFMQAEVDRLDAEVRELDSEIAKLKQANEGALPDQSLFNLQFLQRADNDLAEVDRQLRGIEESKIIIDAQLAQLEPMAPMIMPDGKGVAPPTDQLRALESQLALLEARYSPDHPDVVRTRRDVDALRLEVGVETSPKDLDQQVTEARAKLAMAREKYSEDHPEVVQLTKTVTALEKRQSELAAGGSGDEPRQAARKSRQEPNNPAYVGVRAERQKLDTQRQALLAEKAQIHGKIADYERRMTQSSDVERQLSTLLRRSNIANENYQRARQSLFTAKMGQAMETQSKGERFSLVEPPDLPLMPSSPNRPMLLGLLVLLTLAMALGWPQVAESMDGSINSARAIERVQGSPPLAEIPLIQTTMDKTHKRNIRVGLLVVAPVIVAIVAVAIHFLWLPLDVMWYVALRRLGM